MRALLEEVILKTLENLIHFSSFSKTVLRGEYEKNFRERNLSKTKPRTLLWDQQPPGNPLVEVGVNKSIEIQKCFPSSSCTALCVTAHLWRNVSHRLLETPTCEGFSSNQSSGGVWMFPPRGAKKAGDIVLTISAHHDHQSLLFLMLIQSYVAWGDTNVTANETWAWRLVWFFWQIQRHQIDWNSNRHHDRWTGSAEWGAGDSGMTANNCFNMLAAVLL